MKKGKTFRAASAQMIIVHLRKDRPYLTESPVKLTQVFFFTNEVRRVGVSMSSSISLSSRSDFPDREQV